MAMESNEGFILIRFRVRSILHKFSELQRQNKEDEEWRMNVNSAATSIKIDIVWDNLTKKELYGVVWIDKG